MGFSAIGFPHTYYVNVYDDLMCYRLFYLCMCDDLSGRDYVLHMNSNWYVIRMISMDKYHYSENFYMVSELD